MPSCDPLSEFRADRPRLQVQASIPDLELVNAHNCRKKELESAWLARNAVTAACYANCGDYPRATPDRYPPRVRTHSGAHTLTAIKIHTVKVPSFGASALPAQAPVAVELLRCVHAALNGALIVC